VSNAAPAHLPVLEPAGQPTDVVFIIQLVVILQQPLQLAALLCMLCSALCLAAFAVILTLFVII
jgi:hypothetical protein